MNQVRFSISVKSFLVEKVTEFIKSINYKDDTSFDCDLRNTTNEFSIWFATYNSEITNGLEDLNGKTDIHTHISYWEQAPQKLTTIQYVSQNKMMSQLVFDL